jgi:hypothetical protein
VAAYVDAALLELLDQRRLCVSRRWLREVLLRADLETMQRFLLDEDGKRHVLVLVVLPLPDLLESLERDHRPRCAEHVVRSVDQRARVEDLGGTHLTRHEAPPDEVVQPELVA